MSLQVPLKIDAAMPAKTTPKTSFGQRLFALRTARGYTQVMRRVAAPEAREWSELGRTMIQGIYRDLVLGALDDRCFAHQF